MSSISMAPHRFPAFPKNVLRKLWEMSGIPRSMRLSATEHQLMQMSDYQLRDIGITRDEVTAVVRGGRSALRS